MSIDVNRLGGSLGAEIRGLDLAHVESSDFDAIRSALLEHHVLAFRDPLLTPEQQVAFGRRLGELDIHPIIPHLDGHPEIVPISNFGKRRSLTEAWHFDLLSEAGPTPDLCYRHRWLPGDLVLWDNRSVQHYAVHDHGDTTRTMHRFTEDGDRPR